MQTPEFQKSPWNIVEMLFFSPLVLGSFFWYADWKVYCYGVMETLSRSRRTGSRDPLTLNGVSEFDEKITTYNNQPWQQTNFSQEKQKQFSQNEILQDLHPTRWDFTRGYGLLLFSEKLSCKRNY